MDCFSDLFIEYKKLIFFNEISIPSNDGNLLVTVINLFFIFVAFITLTYKFDMKVVYDTDYDKIRLWVLWPRHATTTFLYL